MGASAVTTQPTTGSADLGEGPQEPAAQPVATGVADGWYPDPGRVHESRYLDHGAWTDFVSDRGLVFEDHAAPRRRRRWPWVVGGLAGVVALALFAVFAVGLNQTMDDLDVYTADLAQAPTGFPVGTTATTDRQDTSDGYQMTLAEPDSVLAAGLKSPTSHLVLAIAVDATPFTVPAGSEFGVQCWQDEGSGYGLLLAADGAVRLVSGSVAAGDAQTVATGTAAPPQPGTSVKLTLACDVIGSSAHLAGYVDGRRVAMADVADNLAEINAGGMVLTTADEQPTSWLMTRFERMGVHNMPPGWRG